MSKVRREEIASIINQISGRNSPYKVFSDWVEMMALSIVNTVTFHHNDLWKQREENYANIRKQYSDAEFEQMAKATAMLVEELEENPGDVLGEVFMKGGFASNQTGQFFTPFNLSRLSARLAIDGQLNGGENNDIHVNEPSCGAGGMIIAAALELKDKGINYQKRMKVVAQDLDWRAVYMCYVQLSLLGIDAEVVQGNTLSDPYIKGQYPPGSVLRTPKRMGVIM